MKALIFTMTCGEGHNMMAKSLSQAFNEKGVENIIVQTHGYNQKRLDRENKMFLWACKHIPNLYDFVWNKLRKKNKPMQKLPYYVKDCVDYFNKKIKEYEPDIIVCTHFYASSVLTYMKNENLLNNKVITSTILVDFCLAPYWEHSVGVNYVFQPYTNTTNELIEKGFNENQIITTGLPIRQEFFNERKKTIDFKKALHLNDLFTILIIGGGNGLGNTLKLLKSILKKNLNIQIIVINGKNVKNCKKISNYIEKNKITNIVNLGFVDNVDEYMRASDLLICRCGSSVLSEAVCLGKPFIAREKMILNEKINKKFFINEGCALGLNKITEAGEKIKFVLENPIVYKNMQNNIKKMQRKNPSKIIVDFLIDKVEKVK